LAGLGSCNEQHPRHAGIESNELDVGQKHRLEGSERRGDAPGRPIDACQQTLGDPLHDRLPHRLFAREVPKQRTLRQGSSAWTLP
jgi:hypothetical protein